MKNQLLNFHVTLKVVICNALSDNFGFICYLIVNTENQRKGIFWEQLVLNMKMYQSVSIAKWLSSNLLFLWHVAWPIRVCIFVRCFYLIHSQPALNSFLVLDIGSVYHWFKCHDGFFVGIQLHLIHCECIKSGLKCVNFDK